MKYIYKYTHIFSSKVYCSNFDTHENKTCNFFLEFQKRVLYLLCDIKQELAEIRKERRIA